MGMWQRTVGRLRLRHDLQEEIAGHLAEREEALRAAGMPALEARQAAHRAFGNVPLMVERGMAPWAFGRAESLWSDVRLAVYRLWHTPGYTLIALLTLAIGIGANAAIFTVIDDAMLRSLPVKEPARLAILGYQGPQLPRFANVLWWQGMEDLQGHLHGLEGIGGWSGTMATVPDEQNTLRSVPTTVVTGNALEIMGVRPYLGRLLTPADDVPGGPEGGWPVVLDYGFWLSNFHGDVGTIGRRLRISGHPAVIVGVLPKAFGGIFKPAIGKLYLPLHFLSAVAPDAVSDPFLHPEHLALMAVARMQPGMTLARLNAQLMSMPAAAVQAGLPDTVQHVPVFRNVHLAAESGARGFSALQMAWGKQMLLVQGLVAAVLLLCCVNLAGLQLARLQARQHEFALRSAVGAGRGRILQQCLVESLVLALAGSLAAGAVAWSSVRTLSGFFTSPGAYETTQLQPDLRILLFTTVLAGIATLLFGLAPALVAGSVAPGALLKNKGMAARKDRFRHRLLIPAQFAIALALVFVAGLFVHTLTELRNNHAGFSATDITEVTAQFQTMKKSPDEIAALYRGMTDLMRAKPGIEAVSYTWVTPLTSFAAKVTAHSTAHATEDHSLAYNDVSDGYFETVQTALLAGRAFTEQDRDRSVCVVNVAASRMLFGGNALGSTLTADNKVNDGDGDGPPFQTTCRVVGVVEDARYASLRETAPATVYFPAGAGSVKGGGYANNLVFFIRSRHQKEAMDAYRAALARYAPDTGYMVFLPLQEQVDQALGSERLLAHVGSLFAAVALLLSGIGLFGILDLRVQRRLPEMGVRLAVGASRGHILRLILADAMGMVALGAAAGVVLIALSSRMITKFLYATSPTQPSVVLAALLLLLLVALAAAIRPARRAARLDPAQVMRNE